MFLVHGLNDWNVKTKQAVQWWNALAKRDVPRKIWLHQGAHFNPFSFAQRNAEWLRQLHHWFDFYLYGLRNGIMDEPQADVESGPGQWAQHASWPLPGTRDVRLNLSAGKDGRNGTLSDRRPRGDAVESFVDQNVRTAEQLAENVETTDPNRLAYLSDPVTRDVRLSGTPKVSVRAAFQGGHSPYLTALLVDYGTDARAYGSVVYGATPVCYGQGVPGDTGCARLAEHITVTAPYKIITRGWIDVRNRESDSRTATAPRGPFLRLRRRPPAQRLRRQGRPPDRRRAHLHRPRLHPPPARRDRRLGRARRQLGHASPGRRPRRPRLVPSGRRAAAGDRLPRGGPYGFRPLTEKRAPDEVSRDMRRLRSLSAGRWRRWTPFAMVVVGLMAVGLAVGGVRLDATFDLDAFVPDLSAQSPLPGRAGPSIPGPGRTTRWGSSPSGPWS